MITKINTLLVVSIQIKCTLRNSSLKEKSNGTLHFAIPYAIEVSALFNFNDFIVITWENHTMGKFLKDVFYETCNNPSAFISARSISSVKGSLLSAGELMGPFLKPPKERNVQRYIEKHKNRSGNYSSGIQ